MLFSEWLAQHARGVLDHELGAAVAEVATATATYDKDGTLNLELKFTKTGGRILVAGKVKTKPAEAAPEAGIYFLGPQGTLSKEDPWQEKFDLTIPADSTEPPRTVDAETGEIKRVED